MQKSQKRDTPTKRVATGNRNVGKADSYASQFEIYVDLQAGKLTNQEAVDAYRRLLSRDRSLLAG